LKEAYAMFRKCLLVILVLILFIVPLYIRTFIEARSSLREAQEFMRNAKVSEAIQSYRTSVSWESPGNPYSRAAAEELFSLAKDTISDPDVKLEALRELRSALIGSRNILRPENSQSKSEMLEEVETEMEPFIRADLEKGFVRDLSLAQVHYGYQVVAQLLFWSWVGCAILVIYRAFSKVGTVSKKKLFRGIAAVFFFYVLWLFSLTAA